MASSRCRHEMALAPRLIFKGFNAAAFASEPEEKTAAGHILNLSEKHVRNWVQAR
jgi:hypothetical protein